MAIHESIQAALRQMVPLTGTLGILVDKAQAGSAHVRLPKSDLVLNHLGMFHAIPLYALAESATAAAFAATFDLSETEMVTRSGSIEYKKVAVDTVHCRAGFDEAELNRIRSDLEETGRAKYAQELQITDPDGDVLCEAVFKILIRKNGRP